MEREIVEQFIFKNIFQLSNKLQVEGDKLCKELTLKQWLLLTILYKSPNKNPSVNDIALSMGITRQSVKKILSTLEKEGYVTSMKSLTDSRALTIIPTDKAYKFLQTNKYLGNNLLGIVFNEIDTEDLVVVFDVLNKIKLNLNSKNE